MLMLPYFSRNQPRSCAVPLFVPLLIVLSYWHLSLAMICRSNASTCLSVQCWRGVSKDETIMDLFEIFKSSFNLKYNFLTEASF